MRFSFKRQALKNMFEWLESDQEAGTLLLFCPIETKAREMDAKILLSCVAAERGHKVIVGHMRELRSAVEFLPRGIYLSKSIPDSMERYFKRFKSLGYGVTAWCEEGLVFLSRDDYKKKMVSRGTLSHADLFFAWGDNQARAVVEKAPEAKDKIRCVGNPRIDMLRNPYRNIYAEDVNRLRSTYGDYILFNTNFSIVNSMLGTQQEFMSFKKRGKIRTKEDEDRYWQHYEHKRAIFKAMGNLIGTVSEWYPDKRIIVRPHPSEDHETWRQITNPHQNADVVFEGTVIPWLMAADVLIHNGCTTAVEAYFLETPAIAYRPVVKEGYELELPNSVSIPAGSDDEVREMISFALNKDNEYDRWRLEAEAKLEAHIPDPDGAYACDRIVDELELYYTGSKIVPEPLINRVTRWGKHRVKEVLRSARKVMRAEESKTQGRSEEYRRQKFPGISISEIEQLITNLQRESGRFNDVAARPAKGMKRCFVVERC